jgi:hypothetical protein
MIVGEKILNKALLLLNLETFCFHLSSRNLSPTTSTVQNMYITARHTMSAAITLLSEDIPPLPPRPHIPTEQNL